MTVTALQESDVALPWRKWPKYSDYKPTGLTWLSMTPAHWSAKRLRYAVRFPTKSEIRGLSHDTSVSFVPMEAVGEYGGLALDQTRQIEDVLNGYTYFRNDDVLIAKITPCFENGKGALAKGLESGIGFGTTELHVLRAGCELHPQYLLYLTFGEHFRKLGEAEMYGAGGQKRVPEWFIKNLRHPLPPLDEQRTIAAFLDRETVRIDALIAKKQRLIELLKEKRQAVISRAVTKGLDPKAAMRPSGINWLGDVPEHWETKRLRFSMQSIEQGWSPQCEGRQAEDYEWGVLKVGCVNEEQFDPSENKALPPEMKPLPEYEIKEGDLLMSRANTRELLGSATLVGAVRPRLLLCDKLYRIHVQETAVLPNYLLLFFESSVGRFQFERDADGTSGSMKNIGQDTIKNTVVTLPPLPEQQRIVDAVAKQQSLISDLRGTIDAAIEKLRIHRSALITAAVTGQIDVRHHRTEAPT